MTRARQDRVWTSRRLFALLTPGQSSTTRARRSRR